PPPLPQGDELLALLRGKMRRNRRGPGWSGTIAFLAKALRQSEEDLLSALAGAGLTVPEDPSAKPAFVDSGEEYFWLKQDQRGGVWINARDRDKKKQTGDKADGDRP